VILAVVVSAAMVLAAIAPGLLTSRTPDAVDITATLRPPSLAHPFGTDQLGRDVFTRIVYGARASLVIGFGATAIGVAGGAALGLLAGLSRRLLDALTMRFVDILFALPEFLMAIIVIAIVGRGEANLAIALGIAGVPGYARLIRSRVLLVRRAEYVETARGFGRRPLWLALRHVLPNSFGPVLALATISSGTCVVAGAGLSYLGLGAAPPSSDWGSMLAAGQDLMQQAWWIVVFPGVAVVAVVFCTSVLGRALRRSGR
jgi:peptide/nickel transport system permease protein